MRKAFWIWNIPNCEGGDPLLIAGEAVKAGLTDVFVKVADGPIKFGVYSKVDKVPAVVAALKAVGVRVWGWQYIYGNNPTGEADIATARIKELGLDGYIVDAEMEFKKAGWGARAETYLSRLKANNQDVTIAFSSYRYPHYHPEFPWAVFFKYCDINMPQVYWLQAHNASQQTQASIERFRSMSTLPLMPAAPAWKENGWAPTLAEIEGFEKVCESYKIELVSYWSWEHCRRDLPHLWPKPVVVAPPPPPPPSDDRMSRIEKKIIDLEKVLAGLSSVVTDLAALVRH